MTLLDFLRIGLQDAPDIKPGEFKLDVVPAGEIQRCAGEMTETNPGSSNIVTDTLMFPFLFRRRKKVKK